MNHGEGDRRQGQQVREVKELIIAAADGLQARFLSEHPGVGVGAMCCGVPVHNRHTHSWRSRFWVPEKWASSSPHLPTQKHDPPLPAHSAAGGGGSATFLEKKPGSKAKREKKAMMTKETRP